LRPNLSIGLPLSETKFCILASLHRKPGANPKRDENHYINLLVTQLLPTRSTAQRTILWRTLNEDCRVGRLA